MLHTKSKFPPLNYGTHYIKFPLKREIVLGKPVFRSKFFIDLLLDVFVELASTLKSTIYFTEGNLWNL
jgi:hypothetical protein